MAAFPGLTLASTSVFPLGGVDTAQDDRAQAFCLGSLQHSYPQDSGMHHMYTVSNTAIHNSSPVRQHLLQEAEFISFPLESQLAYDLL